MKPTEFLREFDRKDSGEYNDEAGMALSNLETICRSARELEKHIDTEENLPEWCQEKLAVVKGMLVAVTDYMVSQDTLDAKQDDFAFNTVRIAEQLNSMLEGGAYDLPGIDYDRPGDIKIKQRPHMAPQRPRHPDDPDFMDPDQRRLRADQARVKKAQDEYHAKKKGVAEKITPPGKDDMEQYRKDTADMAKRAIVNKTPMSKNPVNEFAGGMGASSVAIAPGVGKGAKVGSLFGGSYAPKSPFNKKRKQ